MMGANGSSRCGAMTNDYRPIACDAHSMLELLVLRRRCVKLTYLLEEALRVTEGIPVDLFTRQGAEYLKVECGADTIAVRLDRLESIHDGPERVFARQFSGE